MTVCVCVSVCVCDCVCVWGGGGGSGFSDESDLADGFVPTPKRRKLAREDGLKKALDSGLYPQFLAVAGPSDLTNPLSTLTSDGASEGGEESDESDLADGFVPTPKRRKLAREDGLKKALDSGLYPQFLAVAGPSDLTNP